MISHLPDWLLAPLAALDHPDQTAPFLFHGTVEPFEGRLRPGGYDGVLWTAEGYRAPCIAQSYIPENGLRSLYPKPLPFTRDAALRPMSPVHRAVLEALGVDIAAMDCEHDASGRLISYRTRPSHPTEGDGWDHILSLGYVDDGGSGVFIKTRWHGDREEILPASYKKPGRLFIIERPENLRVFDRASLSDGDLLDRQYHDLAAFRRAETAGYDAIAIADLHRTQKMGLFSHRSTGILPPAHERLRYVAIEATHHDPGDEPCWAPPAEWVALWQHARLTAPKLPLAACP